MFNAVYGYNSYLFWESFEDKYSLWQNREFLNVTAVGIHCYHWDLNAWRNTLFADAFVIRLWTQNMFGHHWWIAEETVLVVSSRLWFAVIATAMINGLNRSAVSSMDQRHSWGTNSPRAGQEISFALWDTHVLCHFQKCPLPMPFPNQNSATHILTYCSISDIL